MGKAGKLLAIAAAVGGGYLALNRGAPPVPAPIPVPEASQPAQEQPIPLPPLPEPRPVPKNEPSPPPPVAREGSKAVPAAKSPAGKPKASRKGKEAPPEQQTAAAKRAAQLVLKQQKQAKAGSYCDNLRRRMAATPKRTFSCAEMKAARSCERAGDRGKATAAQVAKGWECWNSGQL